MFIYPKIINWGDVKSQFGFKKSDACKNAIEISAALTKHINKPNGVGIEKIIFVKVTNCSDAIFERQFVADENDNIPQYEYTGTCG